MQDLWPYANEALSNQRAYFVYISGELFSNQVGTMIFKALPCKHESSFLEMSLVMNETYSSESNYACNLTFTEKKEKKIRKQTLSVIRLLCIRISSQTVSSFFFLLLSISGR